MRLFRIEETGASRWCNVCDKKIDANTKVLVFRRIAGPNSVLKNCCPECVAKFNEMVNPPTKKISDLNKKICLDCGYYEPYHALDCEIKARVL